MKHRRVAEDALDDLFRAPPAYLARWMARKIAAAGGESQWIPVASPRAVIQALDGLKDAHGAWSLQVRNKCHDAWGILAAGLLQSLACLTTDAAGKELGCHGATVSRRVKLHKSLTLENEEYALQAGLAARCAIDRTFARDG